MGDRGARRTGHSPTAQSWVGVQETGTLPWATDNPDVAPTGFMPMGGGPRRAEGGTHPRAQLSWLLPVTNR